MQQKWQVRSLCASNTKKETETLSGAKLAWTQTADTGFIAQTMQEVLK